MKKKHGCLFWILSGVGLVLIGIVILFGLAYRDFAPVAEQLAFERFNPECGDDKGCKIWEGFRNEHPFPYQSFAIAPSLDGTLVLVISEPPPTIPKAKLEELIRVAFGEDLLHYTNRRWFIGIDGWLEDVVLQLKSGAPQFSANPENDPAILDRVAVLQKVLFGTTFGGVLERADNNYAETALSSAPDIGATPAELHQWTAVSSTLWMNLNFSEDDASSSLDTLLQADAAGSYIDADRQLVLFVLPRKILEKARVNDEGMDKLRVPFRQFAVSSDTILGGAWSKDGSLAIIGRSRRTPVSAIPPLRFETFAALARENSNELQQSYERNNLFALKLKTGPHSYRDWAPILLSESLINTEFGALLNITDQFLKSWSEAGYIDYLYFNYPLRPLQGKFVFGDEPLSDIVRRETGGLSVLFNWNTAGAAVTLHDQELSVLSAGRTSALPVTYGSDVNTGKGMQTGDQLPMLRTHENDAYNYFVTQRDPNLARVVSYTLIYQVFQAARTKSDLSRGQITSQPRQRVEANALLVRKAEDLLLGIERMDLKGFGDTDESDVSKALVEAHDALQEYYDHHDNDRARLALIIADPRRAQAEFNEKFRDVSYALVKIKPKMDALAEREENLKQATESAKAEFSSWLQSHQEDISSSIQSEEEAMALLPDSLQKKLTWIKKERDAINLEAKPFQNQIDKFKAYFTTKNALEAAVPLIDKLKPVIYLTQDIDGIRSAFLELNKVEPDGWIKTPSMVISWRSNDFDLISVGGHNLTARTLRIEVDADARSVTLVHDADGTPILRVPKSQSDAVSGQAREIARKIEHEKATIESVNKVISELPKAPPRSAKEVLGEPSFDLASIRCGLGCESVLSNADMKPLLMSHLQKASSISAAMMRNQEGFLVSSYRQGNNVKCCKLFADTASMHDFITESLKAGDVMFLGENDAYVENLAESIAMNDPIFMAAAAGGGGRITPPPPPGNGKTPAADPGGIWIFRAGDGDSGGPRGPNAGGSDFGGKQKRPTMLAWLFGDRQSNSAAATKHRDFSSAMESHIESVEAKQVLIEIQRDLMRPGVQWSEKRDGKPFVIHLRLTDAKSPAEANIVAGLDPAREAEARQTVIDAVSATKSEAQKMSFITFQNRVKAYVNKNPGRGGVKRIMSMIKDGELQFRIARNDDMLTPDLFL
ncbi:hypothetical protein ACQE3E_17700 [Methylomonas sp. MED-D]|uniref:hypothetical protein n=1 Tax=Methylomonas sp. MED-D TaxID=3418768 RepID=UPI003D04CE6A